MAFKAPLCGHSATLCGPLHRKQANGCLGLKFDALFVLGWGVSLPGGFLSVPPLEDLSTLAAFPPLPKVELLPFDRGVLRFDGPSL